jgi:CheY-like chemotaxis protein
MPRKKILVVDDSATILMVMRMVLGKDRYQLITAVDGRQAVEAARREKPDLILMDVIMPNMTGIEACQELRRNAETREIPIVLVTTRSEPENVEKGFTSGCNDYISKPINGLELVTKVESLLGDAA